jgi:acyl carrier protein
VEAFYAKLAEILDVETVQPGSVLRDFEAWDSLSVLSLLAMVDAKYGITLKPAELAKVKLAQELAELVELKIASRSGN